MVTSANDNNYYLVIDRQRGTENVYFLDTVTERDLIALAEASGQVIPTPEPTIMPIATPEPTPVPEPIAEPQPEKKNNSMVFMVILFVLAASGAGYYFKVVKGKDQQDMQEYDEDDEDDYPDVDDDSDDYDDEEDD